jgi:GDYXXLXY motif protein
MTAVQPIRRVHAAGSISPACGGVCGAVPCPPVRLSARTPRRSDDVAGALPLGQRVGVIGGSGLVDPIHESDDLGQLLGQCVQLRAGADVGSAGVGIESYYVQEGTGHRYEQAIRDRKLSAELAVTSSGQAALEAWGSSDGRVRQDTAGTM